MSFKGHPLFSDKIFMQDASKVLHDNMAFLVALLIYCYRSDGWPLLFLFRSFEIVFFPDYLITMSLIYSHIDDITHSW